MIKRLSQTFQHGKEVFRLNSDGTWDFLSFGWHMGNTGTPTYQYIRVSKDSVPKAILSLTGN